MTAPIDAAAILVRTMEHLSDDTKRRRAELGTAEPRDAEVRSAAIAAGLIAAGWPAELLSWDDRHPPGRTWHADTVRLLRRTDDGLIDVVAIQCHFDRKSYLRESRERDARTGPTRGDIYGAGCDDAWSEQIQPGDVWPTEEELRCIAAVVLDARREIAHDVAIAQITRWHRDGGPEPCLDEWARTTAHHRFTGRVAVVPIIPNRLWRTEPHYGPAGYVRYWPPSEEMPRNKFGVHIGVDGGSFHCGHEWGHFTGKNADELLRRDPVARLAIAKAKAAAIPRREIVSDLPPPPAPADFRQVALF